MSTTVTTAKETAVSTDVMDDIFDMAGEGAAFDSSEMQIPFIRVLQALSPQLNKKKPEYIEGAAQGDLFNTVTGEHWSGEEGVTLIPCFQTTKYLEFTPRESWGAGSRVRSTRTATCCSRPAVPGRRRSCQTVTSS